MTAPRTVSRGPAEGEALWVLGGLYTYKALPAETEAYLMVEVEGAQGFAAPMHVHPNEDEGFYVVSGSARILIGDRTIEAPAGTFVHAPKGERHGFVYASPETKLLLLLSHGSEHEELFRALGEPAPRREIPPRSNAEPDFARLGEIAAKHGTTIVGPPPQ